MMTLHFYLYTVQQHSQKHWHKLLVPEGDTRTVNMHWPAQWYKEFTFLLSSKILCQVFLPEVETLILEFSKP